MRRLRCHEGQALMGVPVPEPYVGLVRRDRLYEDDEDTEAAAIRRWHRIVAEDEAKLMPAPDADVVVTATTDEHYTVAGFTLPRPQR